MKYLLPYKISVLCKLVKICGHRTTPNSSSHLQPCHTLKVHLSEHSTLTATSRPFAGLYLFFEIAHNFSRLYPANLHW